MQKASAPPLSVARQAKQRNPPRQTQRQDGSRLVQQGQQANANANAAVSHVPLAQVVTESQVFDPDQVVTAVPIDSSQPQQNIQQPERNVTTELRQQQQQTQEYMPEVLDWETCKSYLVFSKNFNPTSILPKSQLIAKASESIRQGLYFNEEERTALSLRPLPKREQVVFSSYGKWKKKVDYAKRSRSRKKEHISHVVVDRIHDGVMSSHERLNSPSEISAFFDHHNFPPSVHIRIRAQRFDNSSEKGVYMEDFEVDLSRFVLPYGKLTSMEKKMTIEQILEAHCECESKLKSVGVRKEVHFNFKALFVLLQGYFRAKLSYSNVECSAQIRNTSIRVTSSEGYPRMWESEAGRVLTSISVVGGLAMAFQGIGVRRKNILSTFAVPYSVIQVFKAVVEQLALSTRPFQS